MRPTMSDSSAVSRAFGAAAPAGRAADELKDAACTSLDVVLSNALCAERTCPLLWSREGFLASASAFGAAPRASKEKTASAASLRMPLRSALGWGSRHPKG